MAASLVPAYASDSEPAVKRSRFVGDFFASGAADVGSDSDSDGESDREEPAHAVLPPPSSGLPSVDDLFASVSRPAFLEAVETRPSASLAREEASLAFPPRSTVGGAPVRYTAEQAEKRAQLTALRREEAAAAEPADVPRVRRPTAAVTREAAAANPAAALPRREQEHKDRERAKRDKGQSTHASWKTEAEMVMRQQYD